MTAGGIAAWIASGAGAWAWPLAAPGALAFALVASRSLGLLPWAIGVLGAQYAAALAIAGHTRVDGRAPAVAAGLVAVAELVAWSRELEPAFAHERTVLLRRALRIALVVVGSGAVAAGAISLAAAPLAAGLAGDALGIAAAVAALGLVAMLARRLTGGSAPDRRYTWPR